MRCREESEASGYDPSRRPFRKSDRFRSLQSLHQERRLSFNSPELIQGGTQAHPRVKTARISWKSLARCDCTRCNRAHLAPKQA